MDLSLSGLASGFDWQSLVAQLVDVERAPQRRLRTEQSSLRGLNSAYGNLRTQLQALQKRAATLKEATTFGARTAASSDTSLAGASAADNAALGTYSFAIRQLATASSLRGAANAGAALSPTNDVSSLVLGAAGFSTAVTAGTFTVDGHQVSVATTDTLQQVFDRIATATEGAVTGSYDALTDKITLARSSGELLLGSATDTSNFLSAAKLGNNGTGSVSSAQALGGLRLTGSLSAQQFATPLSGGSGEFTINGVSIAWTSTDSLSDVLARISNSSAGVTASYDASNDRFQLTGRTTGDVGIAVQDVSGNFLAAAGLAGGTLTRGNDLLYSVNGGEVLRSRSNTIAEESSGIQGLSVNVSDAAGTAASTGASLAGQKIVSAFGGSGAASTQVTLPSAHAFATGDTVRLRSTGSLPGMTDAATTYYVRVIDSTHVSLHPTLADAVNDSAAVDFGSAPPYTGDAYLAPYDPFSATSGAASGTAVLARFNVTVGADTAKIKQAITDFVAEYNKAQTLIDSQTASSTDANGKVTAGVMASQFDVSDIASRLRSLATSPLTGVSGALKQLENLGIVSNGDDNAIALNDAATLDQALLDHLDAVKDLFSNSTDGVGRSLYDYLERTVGEEGSLIARQDALTKQATDIDTQIADMERSVLAEQDRLKASFVAMETAQAKINQQLQFLAKTFSS